MTDTSSAHFDDNRAKRYNTTIRKVIPGYEMIHQLTRMILLNELKEKAEILVVGAGGGEELCELYQRDWFLTGIDPSLAMVETANARVKMARAKVICGKVEDLPQEPLYDAATCILVMHFLPDDGAKENLLKSISQRLKPGAPLILADLGGEKEGSLHQNNLAIWRIWQEAALIPPKEIDKGFVHVDRDIFPLNEQRINSLCQTSGLSSPLLYFRALCFSLWLGHKV